MTFIIKQVVKYLRDTADKIEQGKCDITNDLAMEIISVIANESLSKALACDYLNLSRSRFDALIREGRIPKGKKIKGFKELLWRKSDLISI